jgi:DNA-binding CsgD family transcriptional regulator
MQRIFRSFVDSLVEGVDTVSLGATLSDVAEAFGFPLFAYFSIPAGLKSTAWLISNYSSEWTGRYVRDGYERRDPVIIKAENAVEPFVWGEGAASRVNLADERRFFEEASAFGIRWGYTIPMQEHGIKVAAVTFAGSKSVPSFERTFELQGRILQLMAMYFHRHAKRLLGGSRIVNGIVLTKRELECLEWASRGKSARDMAQILGVSRRTAAFHLDNARAKLDVRSVQQAIALLAASRLAI